MTGRILSKNPRSRPVQLREGWLQLYWSPDELQDDRQRALALPGLLQLDPGEGRGQRHRHARRGPATHAAWTRGTFTKLVF